MLRDYLPVLLQIIVAALFAVSALLVSILVGKRGRRSRAKDTAYECGMIPQGGPQPRFSVKFYVVAMLFILFDLEIVFMYPWAVVYRDAIKQGSAIFWSMFSFVTILMVGYVYALKKGALDFRNNASSLASAASDSLDPTVMHVLQRSAENNAGAIDHVLPPHGTTPDDVELSIVIPAMNEEITVGEFMEWCKEGIERAGVTAQILIVDSSTDNTPKIVLEHGGEVLRVPKRGVGSAYLDSLPYVRGKWILMGDADLTYDFREIAPFVEEFRKGAEFIMGSRFRGSIEKDAMPKLHRYFGTPLTNWILNQIYRSNFSDIHCGIRGVTREALDRINITSRGWEYASEMVLKAARLKLISSEVPIKFYKDREGRLSHHLRVGWRSPWLAGWVNLKVMLVYAADSFLLKAGAVLLVIGMVLSLGLAAGPVRIGRIGFSLYWMLLGVMCATLGYSSIQIGVLARVMHGLRPRFVDRLQKIMTYDRGMIASASLSVAGLVLLGNLTYHYLKHGLQLEKISHPAILGLLLIILGFQTFGFTLLMEVAKRVVSRSRQ